MDYALTRLRMSSYVLYLTRRIFSVSRIEPIIYLDNTQGNAFAYYILFNNALAMQGKMCFCFVNTQREISVIAAHFWPAKTAYLCSLF